MEIGFDVGSAIMGGLSALGANSSNSTTSAEAHNNRTFQYQMYKNRYQLTMGDMRRAGLNPILAAKVGAGASPQGAMAAGFRNTLGEGAAAATNMFSAQSQADLRDVQKRIQENLYSISTDFMEAWKNSGKVLTDFVAKMSWEELGKIVGQSVAESQTQIIKALQEKHESVEAAAMEFYEKAKKRLIPQPGDSDYSETGEDYGEMY